MSMTPVVMFSTYGYFISQGQIWGKKMQLCPGNKSLTMYESNDPKTVGMQAWATWRGPRNKWREQMRRP